MRTARWAALVLILASGARAAPFAGKNELPRPAVSGADNALCLGLDQSDTRLRVAFAKGSAFPDQVFNAFAGQGSGEATAGDYLTRGQELFQQVDAVSAQCRATFGYNASQTSVAEAAAIRRRVQGAKRMADLYLDLPRTIDAIDAGQNPADLALRPQFLTAMYKIADGGDFDAAGTLADAAHAAQNRIRR
jgi:hypothetical protein